MSSTTTKLLVLAGVVALILLAWATGLHERLDIASLPGVIRQAGPLGAVLFVMAFIVINPMHVSAYVFIITASLVWSPLVAILLSFVGSVGSGVAGYGFARWVGREAVQKHIPDRLRRYDDKLEERGITTVITLKLLFFTTPAVSFFLGVSKVRFRDMFLGTVIGNIPWVVFATLASDQISARLFGG